MILLIDVSYPFQWRPGLRTATFKNERMVRAWWLWFAITYCPITEVEFYAHVESGRTHWRV